MTRPTSIFEIVFDSIACLAVGVYETLRNCTRMLAVGLLIIAAILCETIGNIIGNIGRGLTRAGEWLCAISTPTRGPPDEFRDWH